MDLEIKLKMITNDFDNLKKDFSTLSTNYNKLKDKYDLLLEQYNMRKSEIRTLKNENKELKERISYLQEENNELSRMCELYSKSLYNAELTEYKSRNEKAIDKLYCYGEVFNREILKQFQKEMLNILNGGDE